MYELRVTGRAVNMLLFLVAIAFAERVTDFFTGSTARIVVPRGKAPLATMGMPGVRLSTLLSMTTLLPFCVAAIVEIPFAEVGAFCAGVVEPVGALMLGLVLEAGGAVRMRLVTVVGGLRLGLVDLAGTWLPEGGDWLPEGGVWLPEGGVIPVGSAPSSTA